MVPADCRWYRCDLVVVCREVLVKEVTRDQFYGLIEKLRMDVCINVIGNFPYTNEFKFRHGGLMGKVVDYLENEVYPLKNRYYITDKLYQKHSGILQAMKN